MHSPFILMFLFIVRMILLFVITFSLRLCEARDSINSSNPLGDSGDTLVSAGNVFELGFFTLQEGNNEKDNRSYVGIWYYKLIPKTVVWVANRENPLPSDSCGGVFGVIDGNLRIWCKNNDFLSTITNLDDKPNIFNRTLQLLDTGNLILFEDRTAIWQSFENPTDTFLPGMKMSDDVKLVSWTGPSDPTPGSYTFLRRGQNVYKIQKRSKLYWISGEHGAFSAYNELPFPVSQMFSETLRNRTSHYIYTRSGSVYNSSRILMNYSGEIQYYYYNNSERMWSLLWSEPHDLCSVYNKCGKFEICNAENEPVCECLPGFRRSLGDGCERETGICSSQQQEDSFLNLSLMTAAASPRIPFDSAQNDPEKCRRQCLDHCDCEAYSYHIGVITTDRGTRLTTNLCSIFTGELVNLNQDYTVRRFNLSLRVPASTTAPANVNLGWEASKRAKKKLQTRYVVVFTVLVVGVVLVSFFSYILYRRRRVARGTANRGSNEISTMLSSYESGGQVSNNSSMHENDKSIDVPFYNMSIILSATDNFSDANKLGQGGFGPVYKGTFPGGREIAVKRLSSCSGQGIDEFLNEVTLIAKLQHRNLVRLLGYCIKGTEQILLYEYMPNRSLDAFIFDQKNCLLLDWKKRFDIILGIARGLLYLHQDSRLRVIHRDLKTSNILLDEEMNPKISDFGLARIVEGKGTEARTQKVVGTYGYMSPEYALEGTFSVKSDVFSFGVVLLEIISGKKNKLFANPQEVLNLLGYAWRMWSENTALDLVDPTMRGSCNESQAMTCVNIGLLCIQEDPNDRPSMTNVVLMLGNETSPLPTPNQPAFVVRRRLSSMSSSSSAMPDSMSHNELTISMAQGR